LESGIWQCLASKLQLWRQWYRSSRANAVLQSVMPPSGIEQLFAAFYTTKPSGLGLMIDLPFGNRGPCRAADGGRECSPLRRLSVYSARSRRAGVFIAPLLEAEEAQCAKSFRTCGLRFDYVGQRDITVSDLRETSRV
jgi:hypothetical protein